jgi:NitT/TauT family transport system substrate-binding protein
MMAIQNRCWSGAIWAMLLICAAARPAGAVDSISFNLSWLPQGSQSGVFVAAAKGYYAEANLEVEVVRGYGSVRTTNEIDQGQFTFGFGHSLGVLLNRNNGGAARMVAMMEAYNPAGICWIEGRHTVHRPADLKGLAMGAGSGSPVPLVLPVWLTRNGLQRDDVKLIQMQAGVIDTSLVQGKIDLGECWKGSNLPVLKALAARDGLKVGRIQYGDYKMDIYGNGIVASDKVIKEKPDLVERFVKATLKGYVLAKKDPAAAVAVIMQRYNTLDPSITLEQVTDENDLLGLDEAGGRMLGWMDPAKMELTRDFLGAAYSIGPDLKATDLYTNQFVSAK